MEGMKLGEEGASSAVERMGGPPECSRSGGEWLVDGGRSSATEGWLRLRSLGGGELRAAACRRGDGAIQRRGWWRRSSRAKGKLDAGVWRDRRREAGFRRRNWGFRTFGKEEVGGRGESGGWRWRIWVYMVRLGLMIWWRMEAAVSWRSSPEKKGKMVVLNSATRRSSPSEGSEVVGATALSAAQVESWSRTQGWWWQGSSVVGSPAQSIVGTREISLLQRVPRQRSLNRGSRPRCAEFRRGRLG